MVRIVKVITSLKMELTLIRKLPSYGLTLFPLSEEEQEAIFLVLKTDEERKALTSFLKKNEDATAREIMEDRPELSKRRTGFEMCE